MCGQLANIRQMTALLRRQLLTLADVLASASQRES
jgi:hypothetical protein